VKPITKGHSDRLRLKSRSRATQKADPTTFVEQFSLTADGKVPEECSHYTQNSTRFGIVCATDDLSKGLNKKDELPELVKVHTVLFLVGQLGRRGARWRIPVGLSQKK
jgi:hypothetical protein